MSLTDLSLLMMSPIADPAYVVSGLHYRITVLTNRLLRMEYSETDCFEDRATRLAVNRRFAKPEYTVYHENGFLHLTTDCIHLKYDEKAFSETGLQIDVGGSAHWFYGDSANKSNLKGTIRTLDATHGTVPLAHGLLDRRGNPAVLDDSRTIAVASDGWPVPVTDKRVDLYIFCYGFDYTDCIRDFYRLSGASPLMPRYVLGNWWSRYHAYSDQEYRELLDRFAEEQIPLSCAVIDMDWHIVETPDKKKYGSGWTGYTWNRKLFPQPEAFLKELHRRGLHTTLNLHPRDGIRAYEAAYPEICRKLGRPADGRPVHFDVSDRQFMEAYFDTVLHPMEEAGVDFWWLDWQQKGGSTVSGYDTLWMLNHCHWLDSGRGGRRPLTFSRYADPGSHRYPIGFSGDTGIEWEALVFQPYFTACASNIGFTWWSHDIGGHLASGEFSPELQIRWLEFGVFSPILRLHSTNNPFIFKEPWLLGAEAKPIAGYYLRLRHRLVPYLYAMMVRNTFDGLPLVRPMYHEFPQMPEARAVPNEYYFGSELIVLPITTKRDKTMLAAEPVWLPEGKWFDVQSGRIYAGGRMLTVHRTIEQIPVFAKAGAIVPLAAESSENTTENPAALDLYVYSGADGRFTMPEDNGGFGASLCSAETVFTYENGKTAKLTIASPDFCDFIPENRVYTLHFLGVNRPISIRLNEAEIAFSYNEEKHEVTTERIGVCSGSTVTVLSETDGVLPENEVTETAKRILIRAETDYAEKAKLYNILCKPLGIPQKIAEILSRPNRTRLHDFLIELLTAN